MIKTVLITGVAGLLGSRLAEWIIHTHPHIKVIGIDDLSGGHRTNIPPDVHFYKENLLNEGVEAIFAKHRPDVVYHYAAYAAEGLSPFIRKFNYSNNLVSTAGVVNSCIKYAAQRLVFTSSIAVYGEGTPPFREDDIPLPIDPYGVAKYACELDIQIAGAQHGLDWCILRPHNVYGRNQNIWDRYRNVLGIWMYQHLKGEPFTIFGDGEQERAFSCVDDCLEPMWLAGTGKEASKQIINIGSLRSYTINECAALLKEIIKGAGIVYLEARHEVKAAHPAGHKALTLLNYKDTTPLTKGLLEMWEWASSQPERPQFSWETYELDEGMYACWKNAQNEAH